ncbi:MAG: hypothetical protein EAZ30_11365 [Betaproteobacteria bacterium]|nr:MAG: hypothetical protein EAZ43_16045 [Betaproteobacteria bacterium]TAG46966.1 MAG: hypothetical protein EAZ30_11365 [Betaproteobacteria bacterium]
MGDAIPEVARIVALADVYDSLTHVRPDKNAWTHKASIAEIQRLSGTHFDPKMVELFAPMVNRLRRTFTKDQFDAHLSTVGYASRALIARDRVQGLLVEAQALLDV